MMTALRLLSYHEAGHALVALALGMRVTQLRVNVRMLGGGGHSLVALGNNDRDNLAVLLAGGLAERFYVAREGRGPLEVWSIGDDYERIRKILEGHIGFRLDDLDWSPDVVGARHRAAEIIHANWASLEALATTLLSEIELTGERITEVVQLSLRGSAKKKTARQPTGGTYHGRREGFRRTTYLSDSDQIRNLYKYFCGDPEAWIRKAATLARRPSRRPGGERRMVVPLI